MQFKVLAALIIRGKTSADRIVLKTELPNACWPYTGTQDVSFSCAAEKAEEYLDEHFPGITIELVLTDSGIG